MKQLLGKQKFKELRGAVISHQDTFMQQLWDLHRLSRRQEYLMAVCDEPDKLRAETARMQAEPQAAARVSTQGPYLSAEEFSISKRSVHTCGSPHMVEV